MELSLTKKGDKSMITVKEILNIFGEEHQVQIADENVTYQAGCLPFDKYDKAVKSVSILGEMNALEYLLDEDFEEEATSRKVLTDQIILKVTLE